MSDVGDLPLLDDEGAIRIEQTDRTASAERYELRVRDFKAATLQVDNGLVRLNWSVYGPQQWPDARLVVLGFIELSVLADELYSRGQHERKNPRRPPAPNRTRNRAR